MTTPEHEEIKYRDCPNCGSRRYKTKYVEEQFQVVRCIDCTLVYLANPPTDEILYDEYFGATQYNASDYHEKSVSEPLSKLFDINQKRVALIKIEKRSGRLLDVGCGLGFFMKSAFDSGFDTYGIDISRRAVNYAGESFDLKADAIPIDELLMRGDKFDIITLWHVLEHFLNPGEELNKITKLLNDGGLCFIEVPNLRSLKFMLSRQKWIGGNHPRYHRTFFTRTTLERILKKSGFVNIKRLHSVYPDRKRGRLYRMTKNILDRLAMDSFLTYIARK
jgi:2-polyprenyl-3-methyl-5-hydroxy-6-metoxy-1,4-benzoquinol methylase